MKSKNLTLEDIIIQDYIEKFSDDEFWDFVREYIGREEVMYFVREYLNAISDDELYQLFKELKREMRNDLSTH